MKYLIIALLSLLSGLQTHAASNDQEEIAVLTYLQIKPGTEAEFMAALNTIVKPSLSEPGNVAWYVQQSVNDPLNIVFYTRWKSEAALQLHLNSKPVADYIKATAPLLQPGYPQLVRFHPIDQLGSSSM